MFYEAMLSNFNDGLNDIIQNTSKLLDEANQSCALSSLTLNKLKKRVEKNGFENKWQEIRFFKSVKVIPMQYLIYYTELRSCELRIPKIGKTYQAKFIERKIEKVNAFFAKHTEFLIYMDQEYTHFDKHYFTRKHLHHSPIVKSYPYYKDPAFNTSHDGILAHIRGMALFSKYLKNKKKELEGVNKFSNQGNIRWTGTYAAFIEMIYGCDAMSYFNDGNIKINTIIEELGDFLNVPKGNSSRTYNELKNRKHSRIKFFEEASQKLLDKMSKEDGIGNFS